MIKTAEDRNSLTYHVVLVSVALIVFLCSRASFLCTRATAPPRVVKPPEPHAMELSSSPAKAVKTSIKETLDTRIRCESEIAQIF